MAEINPIELEPNLFLTDCEEISGKLNQISQLTNNTGLVLRTFENDKKLFAIKCHDRQNLEEKLTTPNKKPKFITPDDQKGKSDLCAQRDALNYEINGRAIGLQTTVKDLEDKFQVTVEEISRLQEKLLNEKLTHWKHDQKLWGNGGVLSENLDKLQSWCENLAELIYHNRSQLNTTQALKHNIPSLPSSPSSSDDTISSLQKRVTHLLSTLVKSTFIVENQPPQVLKTKTKFHLIPSVRLLVGRLDIYKNPPKVEVNIISEAQAKVLNQSEGQPFKASGSLDKNTASMQYSESTRHLTATFRNIQLSTIIRSDRSLSDKDSVMDEKFCLHFQCNFGDNELVSKTWTCSLPVVVIVHSSQEPNARATVAWDNAFGEHGRIPFAVPQNVAWYRIGQMLSDQFKSVNDRSLTESQLRFLGEKAFSNPKVPVANESELTWTTFCKNNLPGRDFTFWEWFYATLKLTKNHFRDLWRDGSIIGFVNRQEAHEMLSSCQGGTFLLRFSDSEKQGGISITYVELDGVVSSVLPFTKFDLATRSLADRINDLSDKLSYVYPNIPKDTAFSKYYSTVVTPSACDNGYKPFETKTNIPTRSNSTESTTLSINVTSPHPCIQMDSDSSPSSVVLSYPAFNNWLGATGGVESIGLDSNDASHHSGMQMDYDSPVNPIFNGNNELLETTFTELMTFANGGVLPQSDSPLYPAYSAASPSSHSNASVGGDGGLPGFETLTVPFIRSVEDTSVHGANNMGFNFNMGNNSMSPQPTMQIESNSDLSPGPQSNASFNGGGSYTILQNVSSSMTDEMSNMMSMDIAPMAI